MPIEIGNLKNGDVGEYVGRPSPLGNPFPMKSEEDRDRVCEEYALWLGDMSGRNICVMDELKRLKGIYKEEGSLTLLCHCHPKRCHAESIRDMLLKEGPDGKAV